MSNVAVTDWAWLIVTWQEPVAEQAPGQPVKVEPEAAARSPSADQQFRCLLADRRVRRQKAIADESAVRAAVAEISAE